MSKQLLTITDAAVARVKEMIAKRGKDTTLGVRIGVRTRGCSGMSYTLEFCDEVHAGDERIEAGDVTIFVEPKAILFLVGTVMDFIDEEVQSGFVFKNPNEKGRCGCGESFHV